MRTFLEERNPIANSHTEVAREASNADGRKGSDKA